MTLSGIEPATFQFVAQHLNHCATSVPHTTQVKKVIQKKQGSESVGPIGKSYNNLHLLHSSPWNANRCSASQLVTAIYEA